MPIDRRMYKEAMVHRYNEILLIHKKEHIWVGSNEVDEPRAFYTGWNKSEREKHVSCLNTHIWNLEKWYWWTYLQGSSGDADIENTLVDPVWEGEGGTNWKSDIETCTLPYLKQLASGSLLCDAGNSNLVFCDNLRGVQWGRRCVGGLRGRGHMYNLWLIHVDGWQKLTQYCKAVFLQLKIK